MFQAIRPKFLFIHQRTFEFHFVELVSFTACLSAKFVDTPHIVKSR